uniref:Palmitoyltransferase n=1 Tax=Romanomermis culicivorax TaxID=13658 RepID=A0A915K1N2_ROMCU
MDGNNAQLGGRWCVRDGCGITCAVITWMLIGYAEFCVLVLFLTSDTGYDFHQAVNAVIFHIFIILASTSHVKTMFTDPGAVPKGTATDEYIQRMGLKIGQVIYKCGKCSSIKPERAHHCRRMDHHCPWVNNCVGENNQKYFVLFTFYIAVLSIHTLYWSVWQFTTCLNDDWRSCAVFSPPATTIFLVMLLFEAVLFAIFTSVMCGTQLHAIMTDETVFSVLFVG